MIVARDVRGTEGWREVGRREVRPSRAEGAVRAELRRAARDAGLPTSLQRAAIELRPRVTDGGVTFGPVGTFAGRAVYRVRVER